jgi:Cdc6-like AAA superfamily ATPase
MPPLPKIQRLAQVSQAFTPSAPIDNIHLFADRPEQMMKCLDAFFQRGRHVALYGERGVGKTSMANVVPGMIKNAKLAHLDAVRIDCNTNDDYNSIWRKVFRELRIPLPIELEDRHVRPLDPEDIRFTLQDLNRQTLIVIDEFDRVDDDEALSLLADTVKTLSDHTVDSKLMFVGVAASVEALLGEHESIIRNVEQIPMPRMSVSELTATLQRGFDMIDGLELEAPAQERIISAAEGLPHFAHVLGLASAQTAVRDDRDLVTLGDVETAESDVMKTHSMVSEYRRATQSHQPGHLFEEVLLACAYAPRDSLGCFKPADLRKPISTIVGQDVAISRYQRHLRELFENRGTLHRDGQPRHYVYSFRNPLLQPFVKMVGRAKGVITPQQARALQAHQARESAPSLFDPI